MDADLDDLEDEEDAEGDWAAEDAAEVVVVEEVVAPAAPVGVMEDE